MKESISFTAHRKEAGLTLVDVSNEFGVSAEVVQEWEEGKAQPPSYVIRSLHLIGSLPVQAGASTNQATPLDPPAGRALGRDLRGYSRQAAPGETGKISGGSSLSLTKSKQRIADHGEVFTPPWLVEKMLDLVRGETEQIDSRFLEPACGSGNFLVPILRRKLASVEARYGKSEFDKKLYALQALACCYGIELLPDNIAECRKNMLDVFAGFLGISESDEFYRAASHVLSLNLVHGDAMKMKTPDGGPIMIVEWSYLGKAGKFNRRDFRLEVLTQASGFQQRWVAPDAEQEVSLFSEPRQAYHDRGRDPIFIPIASYPPMTVHELAARDVEQVA